MQYTYYLRGERAEEEHGVSADKKHISIISNRVIRNNIFLYLYFYFYTLFIHYLHIIYIVFIYYIIFYYIAA